MSLGNAENILFFSDWSLRVLIKRMLIKIREKVATKNRKKGGGVLAKYRPLTSLRVDRLNCGFNADARAKKCVHRLLRRTVTCEMFNLVRFWP